MSLSIGKPALVAAGSTAALTGAVAYISPRKRLGEEGSHKRSKARKVGMTALYGGGASLINSALNPGQYLPDITTASNGFVTTSAVSEGLIYAGLGAMRPGGRTGKGFLINAVEGIVIASLSQRLVAPYVSQQLGMSTPAPSPAYPAGGNAAPVTNGTGSPGFA